MGWLLRLVTGAPLVVGGPDSLVVFHLGLLLLITVA